jgi:hypothetical protein
MRHERILQQIEPLGWRFGFAQPLAKFYGRSSPKRLQVNMCICLVRQVLEITRLNSVLKSRKRITLLDLLLSESPVVFETAACA